MNAPLRVIEGTRKAQAKPCRRARPMKVGLIELGKQHEQATEAWVEASDFSAATDGALESAGSRAEPYGGQEHWLVIAARNAEEAAVRAGSAVGEIENKIEALPARTLPDALAKLKVAITLLSGGEGTKGDVKFAIKLLNDASEVIASKTVSK